MVKVIVAKVDGRMENIYKNLHSNQKILIYEMLRRGIDVEVLDENLELIKASTISAVDAFLFSHT